MNIDPPPSPSAPDVNPPTNPNAKTWYNVEPRNGISLSHKLILPYFVLSKYSLYTIYYAYLAYTTQRIRKPAQMHQ